MAMMLIRWREIAVKMRPAKPGVPRIPSPTTAMSPTLESTWIGFNIPVSKFEAQRSPQLFEAGRVRIGDQEAEFWR